jgi:hypothetical protein
VYFFCRFGIFLRTFGTHVCVILVLVPRIIWQPCPPLPIKSMRVFSWSLGWPEWVNLRRIFSSIGRLFTLSSFRKYSSPILSYGKGYVLILTKNGSVYYIINSSGHLVGSRLEGRRFNSLKQEIKLKIFWRIHNIVHTFSKGCFRRKVLKVFLCETMSKKVKYGFVSQQYFLPTDFLQIHHHCSHIFFPWIGPQRPVHLSGQPF